MDILVAEPSAQDVEVLALGAKVITCRRPQWPWLFARDLWGVLRQHGPYDVVHSHVHHYSGWVLSVAALAGVPVRISHSHNDTSSDDRRSSALRGMYLAMMEALLRRSATAGFTCTNEAGAALYGDSWQLDARWSVLHYGIDLDPFRAPPQPPLRQKLDISRDSFVVGHVGRFVEVKNHAFLVAIAQAAAVLDLKLHFLLVGDGPLRGEIKRRVAEAGLSSRFTFADPSSDVAALMTNAMDAFVLPSRREGLPVVLVEAQAAGLPCLVADTVSPESKVVDGLLFWESLNTPAEVWAKRLLGLCSARLDPSRESAWRAIEGSPFDIRSNLQVLEACYTQRRSA